MKPLVFVHGFMGGSAQWQAQEALGQDRPIMCVDLPGFGKNAALDPIGSIDGFANWVLTELTRCGIQEFDLLGHSMGGMIVQEMVHCQPDRVSKLILYGTGSTGVLPGRFETIETSKARANSDGARATARRISATWFLNCEHAPQYEACAAIAEQAQLQAILAGLDAMKSWQAQDRLTGIQQETLVVWGDGDRTYPWSQTETLWRDIPNSHLAVVPNCAHAVHLENPRVFNQLVEDFLG